MNIAEIGTDRNVLFRLCDANTGLFGVVQIRIDPESKTTSVFRVVPETDKMSGLEERFTEAAKLLAERVFYKCIPHVEDLILLTDEEAADVIQQWLDDPDSESDSKSFTDRYYREHFLDIMDDLRAARLESRLDELMDMIRALDAKIPLTSTPYTH